MAIRPTIVAFAALMLVPSLADTQGLTPYIGPDGRTYHRRAADPDYAPPKVPPDIMVPERPRVVPRQRKGVPPIAVVPLEPAAPEPTPTTTPAPAPRAPIESKLNPLAEWCKEGANARTPLCRNVGSSRVQR